MSQPTLRLLLCLTLGSLLSSSLAAAPQEPSSEPDSLPLQVMSFNLRYGSAQDGPNRWELRRETVAQAIRDNQPDLLGTQETEPFQATYLIEQLPEYAYFGRSREDREQGEQCGILYSRERFVLLASGHWWLSQTPHVPGSRSWDSSLPRMATWVQLYDRRSGREFLAINTHFDHRGAQARLESARLLSRKINGLDPGLPVILMGDLNTAPESDPAKLLAESLTDTYARRHGNAGPQGTFGGFQNRTTGPRIDYIWTNRGFEVEDAQIVRRQYAGRDPSDHFPVTAKLQWSDLPTAQRP